MAGEVGGGERMPMAMVDAHGSVARSRMTVAVAVKPATALVTRPYGNDRLKWREVGGAPVAAGHGELNLGGAPQPQRQWRWRNVALCMPKSRS